MSIVFVYIAALLEDIPLWIFAVPLVALIVLCVRFRMRTVLRNVCLAMSLLVSLAAIPPCAARAYFQRGGGAAVERRFPGLADAENVTKYRFVVAGLGDTREFWKLKNVSVSACQRVVDKHDLTRVPAGAMSAPGSAVAAPGWWPKSTKGYAVFEGDDGYMGSIEIWVPQDGPTVYLYRFIE